MVAARSGDMMNGAGRKKSGSPLISKLLLLLLPVVAACAIAAALLLRDRACFVFVKVALLPRIIVPASPPPLPSDDPTAVEAPYAADSRWDIQWDSVAGSLASSGSRSKIARVGLVNFNSSEVARWRQAAVLPPAADVRAVRLAPAAANITWRALYPEWINEDDPASSYSGGGCPSLPDPDRPLHGHDYDLVAVKLPCRRTSGGGWNRDVARLHLQLSAAKLAVRHGSSSSAMVLVLSDARCMPLPNLFPCKHLVARHGHAWLYRPDAAYIRRRLRLPVGSCQLAVPHAPGGDGSQDSPAASTMSIHRRQAYATVLHSGDSYVCGAIALAQSIRQSGSRRELVALVDAQGVGGEQRAALAAAGWQVRAAPRIRNPRAVSGAYNEWNYSKFRLWQLTEYERVVFLDADLLVLRNMDWLFDEEAPELSAAGNSAGRFNSGVMVLEPCNCTFELLMAGIDDIESYNGGDQGYLNEVFTWWHRLPRRSNLLKHAWDEESRAAQARLLLGEEGEVDAVHYLGVKPWLCFRDYDCNWNLPTLRQFASDEAHARWWAVHDRIQAAELRDRFCALPAAQVAALERDRREAERVNAPDAHWRRAITDPRRHVSPTPTLQLL
ncbi:hypothetical protein ACP4OV_025940 [Aristida adscensionis]